MGVCSLEEACFGSGGVGNGDGVVDVSGIGVSVCPVFFVCDGGVGRCVEDWAFVVEGVFCGCGFCVRSE